MRAGERRSEMLFISSRASRRGKWNSGEQLLISDGFLRGELREFWEVCVVEATSSKNLKVFLVFRRRRELKE